jgi:HAD superfamily hydrolase (TIGR01509 family)
MAPLIIYDCDGVLVDSEVLANRVLTEMLAAEGVNLSVEEAIRAFTGKTLEGVITTASVMLARQLRPSFAADYQAALLARFEIELEAIDGAADAIRELGEPRCVASSSRPERLAVALRVTGLAELFAGRVFSAVEVKQPKPAPDIFLYAASRMGFGPDNAIVIEDSVGGVSAGRAAGMRVIGFTGGGHIGGGHADRLTEAGAHDVIGSMADLAASVSRLSASSSL